MGAWVQAQRGKRLPYLGPSCLRVARQLFHRQDRCSAAMAACCLRRAGNAVCCRRMELYALGENCRSIDPMWFELGSIPLSRPWVTSYNRETCVG